MILTLTLLIIGSLLIALSFRQFLFKRKLIKAGVSGALGGVSLTSAALSFLILSNLHTYYQLTKEVDLVDVEVSEVNSLGAKVVLLINGERFDYHISADEWRIDARFIKWKPWFTVLGKEPIVRLEAFSGKLNSSGTQPVELYKLSPTMNQIDEITSFFIEQLGILDVVYGSSVYMPIQKGAKYRVSATHAGLIARPINGQGQNAVNSWK